MRCQQHLLMPALVASVILVLVAPGRAQAPSGLDEQILRAPDLVQTDERSQRAVLRGDDGSSYVVRAGEVDAITGLILRRVGVSTVLFEDTGGGTGLRLRIETDGQASRATWSRESAPAELLGTTPVWTLHAPLDGTVEWPEGDR